MNEATASTIDWHLDTLPGVGAKTLVSLAEAGIYNIWQLLCHIPIRYEDYTTVMPPESWLEHINKDAVLIEGKVVKTWSYFSAGKRLTYCQIQAADISVRIGFFHLHPQIKKTLQQDNKLLRCYGKFVLSGNVLSMYHPKYWLVDAENPEPLEQTLTPIYKSIAGIASSRLQKIMAAALQRIEKLSSLMLLKTDERSIGNALKLIHQPMLNEIPGMMQQAKWHLAAEEAAYWAHLLGQKSNDSLMNALSCHTKSDLLPRFIDQLPFTLTKDQQASYTDIHHDLIKLQPMRRLLQGDVGCGKTVVATMAMLQVIDAGFQAAILAPTIILAKQHAEKLQQWLKPLGVKVAMLISDNGSENQMIKKQLATGEVSLVVGTHALLSEDVSFESLALVVIDEQHRFGVKQREALLQKGVNQQAHALMMSATPIPRSLAQSLFGVTTCSNIKALPGGRKTIQTSLIQANKRDALLKRVISQAEEGNQVYWICPRVEGEDEIKISATYMFTYMEKHAPNIQIALLHGRMSGEEKMQVLGRFAQGDIQILVSTIVVEVGVDVANANIIVIEQAHQFGLAQLHQLRGRVGRSEQQGYCILIYDNNITEEGVERLQCLKETNDGFVLAEKDLMQRGPGQILGFKQSGYPAWRFLQWPEHQELFVDSQKKDALYDSDHLYLCQYLWGQQSLA